MSVKEVSCKVLGHSNGPPCKVCNKPMDTISVQSKGPLAGKVAAYCFSCGDKGIQ